MVDIQNYEFQIPTPASNPGPLAERAMYGFIVYIVSYVCFGAYLVWAYLPHEWLHAIGITYLPHNDAYSGQSIEDNSGNLSNLVMGNGPGVRMRYWHHLRKEAVHSRNRHNGAIGDKSTAHSQLGHGRTGYF
ncbi:hypothetical protein P879_00692 [Paragonimus westermani]|uniref:PIG-P domain-containing protein n=1 Tax=Paragonimus westermani TaxID=34504 RepID=A0A8T0DXK8_9TREM|nr:hypothetical protein P879_00692 [Paragonimus westermani]